MKGKNIVFRVLMYWIIIFCAYTFTCKLFNYCQTEMIFEKSCNKSNMHKICHWQNHRVKEKTHALLAKHAPMTFRIRFIDAIIFFLFIYKMEFFNAQF